VGGESHAPVVIERWMAVTGWPYQVSDQGRIRRVRDLRVLKPWNSKGYRKVDLSCRTASGTKRQRFFVHRLVMATFWGSSTLEVNHKNGVLDDNRLENLEYVTRKENARHGYENGLIKVSPSRS